MQAWKGGTEAMTLGKFFPLIFKSWLLTYAVKIEEKLEKFPPQRNILFLQSMCIYVLL